MINNERQAEIEHAIQYVNEHPEYTPEERKWHYWDAGIWVTREGELIPVENLETKHLQNIWRMFQAESVNQKRRTLYKVILDGWAAIDTFSGEDAQYYLESEIVGLERDGDEYGRYTTSPEEWLEQHLFYPWLKNEAQRRGLAIALEMI